MRDKDDFLKRGFPQINADYFIVNQKWIAKNPLILYIEHRGTEARRNKYIEKVKTIEPNFYSVNSALSKNKALCLCVSVFHSIFSQTNFVLL